MAEKGHVEAVRDILENELGLDIPLSGLIKDEKHRISQLMIEIRLNLYLLIQGARIFTYCKEFRMKCIGL